MFVPNSLPIGISNGNDLVDYIKQTLEFSYGELCPPFASSSAMVNFAPLLPFAMMRLDSAGDDRVINTVTNDGGESMES